MSSQNPGRNRVKAISRRSTVSQIRLRTKKKPWVAAANSMATTATQNTKTAFKGVTLISSSSVLKMKRNGRSAVRTS